MAGITNYVGNGFGSGYTFRESYPVYLQIKTVNNQVELHCFPANSSSIDKSFEQLFFSAIII